MQTKIHKAFKTHPKELTGNFSNLIQFFRFSVSGGISALLEIGTLFLLVKGIHINYLWANTLAFICANILNYILSRYWVYGESKYLVRWELMGFFIAGTIGLALNQLVLFLLFDLFNINLLLSKIFAIAVTVIWNFFSKKHIVFKYE